MTGKSETMDVPLSHIEKSLSSSLKSEIRLAKCTKFKKKCIFRCWVADGPSSFPFPVRWECDEVLTGEIESVYRAELASGFPDALDDAIYYKGILIAWTYWLLRLGPVPNTRGNTIKGTDVLVSRCKAVVRLSHEIEYLPRIGRIFAQVASIHENQ